MKLKQIPKTDLGKILLFLFLIYVKLLFLYSFISVNVIIYIILEQTSIILSYINKSLSSKNSLYDFSKQSNKSRIEINIVVFSL